MLFTEASIPDLDGQNFVVTGANSGIGRATMNALARHGATSITMACRNIDTMRQAAVEVRRTYPSVQIHEVRLDLGSLRSVHETADAINALPTGLDVLICNAGIMHTPEEKSTDGYEKRFATNHLGHFAFAARLSPKLKQSPDPRVAWQSSFGENAAIHYNVDDLAHPKKYGAWSAYFNSKLSNVLTAKELARRAHDAGSPIKSMSAHPGGSRTHIMAGGTAEMSPLQNALNLLAQPAAMGALPILRAATSPDTQSGDHFGPAFIAWGPAVKQLSSPKSYDRELAAKLWDKSVELTGVDFDFAR